MSAAVDLLSAIASIASIASLTEQHVRWMEGPHNRSNWGPRSEPPVLASTRPDQIVRVSKALGYGEAAQIASSVDLSALDNAAVNALVARLVRLENEAAIKLAGPSYSLPALQELVDELRGEACAVLRMIKQLNGGKLPGQPLYEKWTCFGCG